MDHKNNYISVTFGNEDRVDTLDLRSYETPQNVAEVLRKIADNVSRFESSKDYRNSGKSAFEGV